MLGPSHIPPLLHTLIIPVRSLYMYAILQYTNKIGWSFNSLQRVSYYKGVRICLLLSATHSWKFVCLHPPPINWNSTLNTAADPTNGVSCHKCFRRYHGHHRSFFGFLAGEDGIHGVRPPQPFRSITRLMASRNRTRSIFQQLLVYSLTRGFLITLVQIGHISMYLLKPSNLLFW